MTTYRLPDGIEVKATNNGEVTGAGVWVEHPVYGSIAVERDKLTEVTPPLPPEPPDRTHMGCNGYVFTRRDDTAKARLSPDECWFDGPERGMTWAEVVEYSETYGAPLTRLVPDPAADAPELPWKDGEDEIGDKVHVSGGNIYVHITPGYVLPGEAELRAAVILRAVREARAAREAEKP